MRADPPGRPGAGRARLSLALATNDVGAGARPSGISPPGPSIPMKCSGSAHGSPIRLAIPLPSAAPWTTCSACNPTRLPWNAWPSSNSRPATPVAPARLRRKAGLDRARAEYNALLLLPATPVALPRLAHLAETLGWRFEARILWKLVISRRPGDQEGLAGVARTESSSSPRAVPGADLDLLLADLDRARPVRPGEAASGASLADPVLPVFDDLAEGAGLRFTFDNGPAAPPPPGDLQRRRGSARLRRRRLARRLRGPGGPFPAGRRTSRQATGSSATAATGRFEDATEAAGRPACRAATATA